MRVPAVDPKRDKLIRHFEKKLAYFQGIPSHRREDEAADEGEATCRSMLAGLSASRSKDGNDASDIVSLEQWLDEIERDNGSDKG
ncbi:hypothetical protein SAMN06295905_2554 [Devosia lucknowensis]|uniref:Uncharacterized protein n=1 Tax=Devosia lucknowensis TaxID=1096929 RepID=A0A1Y6GA22_9HYPH|nr:hypothetical protein [Devosia lucknowensis]SMQ85277.1 hypothetical protein SAMN06295905_2554 [Devosia lucknowensis]